VNPGEHCISKSQKAERQGHKIAQRFVANVQKMAKAGRTSEIK